MPDKTFSPVALAERESFMDALRGFALLGIFIINLLGFTLYNPNNTSAGGWHFPEVDKIALFAMHIFIEGKFYSIFSLLFGWGLALQIGRIQSHNSNGMRTILRRLTIMFVLGFIHLVCIWSGDIVAFYALTGFVLLLFIKLQARTLAILGVVSIFIPIALYGLKMQWPILNKPSEYLFSLGLKADEIFLKATTQAEFDKLMKEGSLRDFFFFNADGLFYRFGDLFFQSRFFKVLGMFLIGYSLGISGYFKTLLHNQPLLWKIVIAGLIIGLPTNYMLAYYMETPANYREFKIEGLYQTIVYSFGVVPLAISYVAMLALLFKRESGYRILMKLAPVGKMAFTNYILQSVTSVIVFYGIGFGFMGKVGPAVWTIYAVIVFILQIIFSTYWLNHFQFGPIEWIWRSLTYWKMQPMKKLDTTSL